MLVDVRGDGDRATDTSLPFKRFLGRPYLFAKMSVKDAAQVCEYGCLVVSLHSEHGRKISENDDAVRSNAMQQTWLATTAFLSNLTRQQRVRGQLVD